MASGEVRRVLLTLISSHKRGNLKKKILDLKEKYSILFSLEEIKLKVMEFIG